MPAVDLARLARTAVANVAREYPYALVTVVGSPDDLRLPREQHPAFFGCYDWHSAVHTHWLLVRLLRDHADEIDEGPVLAVLDAHLTPENLAAETAYLRDHPGFERPYGWAWLVALAAECSVMRGDDPPDPPVGSTRWRSRNPLTTMADAHAPAADLVVEQVLGWLPRAGRPVRDGTHACTAFALGLLLDAAPVLGRADLATAVQSYVQQAFVPDRDAPLTWEPSGQDFLSPGLVEADLVRRVLAREPFRSWLTAFWPRLAVGEPRTLLDPVTVSDRTDGQLGHLDGLNLSRATALARLALALPADDARRAVLERAAASHRAAGCGALAEDGYLSTHWLGTFALLALDPSRR